MKKLCPCALVASTQLLAVLPRLLPKIGKVKLFLVFSGVLIIRDIPGKCCCCRRIIRKVPQNKNAAAAGFV